MKVHWLMAVMVGSLCAAPLPEEDALFFSGKVAPLLERRCFECHSHQAGKMKGGLTLDSRTGWALGGD
ncbi:MAG: hypothetical protein V4710_13310, partial [Verrucomicrobiota bacterium]